MIMSEYLIINSKKNNINFHVRMENEKNYKNNENKRDLIVWIGRIINYLNIFTRYNGSRIIR